jgi:hypothetical protein
MSSSMPLDTGNDEWLDSAGDAEQAFPDSLQQLVDGGSSFDEVA